MVYLYSIDWITIFVSDHNRPWFLVVAFVIFLGGIFSCIQLCQLKSVGKGGIYAPFLWVVRAFAGWYAWLDERCSSLCIDAYSIVWSSGLLCDPIASFYNTRFHCTTSAYRRNDFMLLHRTTVALNRTSFLRMLVLFTIILETVY